MSALAWTDHATDPAARAAQLGVTEKAVALWYDADVIDLHLDLEVPVRLFGWDPAKRHGPWRRVQPLFGQTDYPRLREGGFTGLCYDIATNVFRPERNRFHTTLRNIEACHRRLGEHPDDFAVVRTRADYAGARERGLTSCWITIQGGNALAHDPEVLLGPVGQDVHRITLVHLSTSVLGGSNSPSQPDAGITPRGRRFVEICNAAHVLVDLAHSGRETFWGALDVHTSELPPIVSHTGLVGAHDHWRNIDDAQARAIADRGGVVGVMYQGNFLQDVPVGFPSARAAILDHLEHLIDVAGEDAAAIGTDYDGMITPPYDLCDITDHPLLVQDMLDRGWSETRIRKILGENYLRVVGDVRP